MVEHPSSSSSWQILHCLRYDNGEDGSCSIPSFPAGASCFSRCFMITQEAYSALMEELL
jgi:hypothetical protein